MNVSVSVHSETSSAAIFEGTAAAQGGETGRRFQHNVRGYRLADAVREVAKAAADRLNIRGSVTCW